LGNEPGDNFTLDAEPVAQYERRIKSEIKRGHAQTANRVASILVWAVVLAFPFGVVASLIAKCLGLDFSGVIETMFERWFSVIGPLAGAAVGGYYVASKHQGD